MSTKTAKIELRRVYPGYYEGYGLVQLPYEPKPIPAEWSIRRRQLTGRYRRTVWVVSATAMTSGYGPIILLDEQHEDDYSTLAEAKARLKEFLRGITPLPQP